MHTDRGSPNLTHRLELEKRPKLRPGGGAWAEGIPFHSGYVILYLEPLTGSGAFEKSMGMAALLILLPARLGPVEVPVGIVTALIGAPIFIFILYQKTGQKK